MREYGRVLTPEDLIRRYDLENLKRDRRAIQTSKNGLSKTDALLREFIKTVTDDLGAIKDQVDGKITTWFFDGEPTLENEPAINWITDADKVGHLGDLYYDKNTGYSYRWSDDGDCYKWIEIVDSAAIQALAIANAAKDTADNKRRVFVIDPYPPYDVGDIWFKEDKEIYRCRASRSEGNYNSADWCSAVNYTDDSYAMQVEGVLNRFIETVEEKYSTKVQLETTKDSILGRVESETQLIRTEYDTKLDEYDSQLIAYNKTVSQLQIDVSGINSTVSNLKTDYDGKIVTMESSLKQQANSIALKLDSSEFTKSAVIELINENSSSTAKINANNISLEGINLDLTSNNISITSDRFKVDKYGNTTISGKFYQYASNDKLSLSIENNELTFYDYYASTTKPSLKISNGWITDDGNSGLKIAPTIEGFDSIGLSVANKDNSNSRLYYLIQGYYNDMENGHTPYIANTSSGTLFGGGITVEHGLIKTWSLKGVSGKLFGSKGGITVDNGLITDWSMYGATGDVYLLSSNGFDIITLHISDGLIIGWDVS